MDKKIAHTQAGSQDKPKFNDNSTHNQRLKMLDWMFERGSITTAQAREHLDIMSLAPRVMELLRAGYLINTVPDIWTSDLGIKHRIGRYVLVRKEPREITNYSEVTI